MVRRTISSTILILGLALLGGQSAEANTPLTRAVVSSLRNQVRLLPRSKPARKANLSDVLRPGDGIVTSRRSLAELRFNDGSLARMGEQAVFRFIPKTRSFSLSNGTVLMLIPPGQGRTQVRTPNVTAGIRGSALIIRCDQGTDTCTVIALTNSQISVTNRDGTQTEFLEAGQAVVAVGDDIVESYDVDLSELYRTSPLLKDLEMNNPDAEMQDEAIAKVREETLEGIRSQRQFTEGEGVDRTQDFRLSDLDVDQIIAEDELDSVVGSSTSFPGRSIGVEEQFVNNNQQVIPTPGGSGPEAVAPQLPPPPQGEPLPVEPLPPIAQPPVFEEQPPIAQPPDVVETPEVPMDLPVADIPPVMDNPVAETPMDNADDMLGGDGIGNDVVTQDPGPIDDAGDLPGGVPIFGGNTGALQPQIPPDDTFEPTFTDPITPNDGGTGDDFGDPAMPDPTMPEPSMPEPIDPTDGGGTGNDFGDPAMPDPSMTDPSVPEPSMPDPIDPIDGGIADSDMPGSNPEPSEPSEPPDPININVEVFINGERVNIQGVTPNVITP